MEQKNDTMKAASGGTKTGTSTLETGNSMTVLLRTRSLFSAPLFVTNLIVFVTICQYP